MKTSQNVSFAGDPLNEFDEQPMGRGLIELLAGILKSEGYELTGYDNWRDCGWRFFMPMGNAMIQVSIGLAGTDLWMLQIANANDPNWIARLFGWRAEDHSLKIFKIANSIHEVLMEYEFTNICWCLNDFPNGENSTSEPSSPDSAVMA